MTIIKCKMCGGDIALSEDKTFGTCEYCGCSMTFPKVDSEQRAAAFNRGNHFRRIGEFDKALAVYEKIVSENEGDAEAHWCCALCRFGIEYVEDPNTYEWFPTCHRVSFDRFLEDVDYKAAVEHSEGITRWQYLKEGLKIAEVQKGILLTSQNTQPYDIFLCYKETDEEGKRTRDSLLAQEIYYQLTEQGRSVFFSRITLEDVPGTAYEPYIFAALNSAKVMIVVGTKPEYLNAPWVKNEWSRFLTLMKKDRSKLMIPCYRDMDPYDLPEQLGVLQSYDMSRLGFLPDLTRGISKVLDNKPAQKENVILQQYPSNVEPLLRRVSLFLEDGDWKAADEYCEKVLDMDPENAEAYLGKLLAEKQIRKKELLGQSDGSFVHSANYQKALRFGDDSVKEYLLSAHKDAAYYATKRKLTETLKDQRSKAFLKEMVAEFEALSGWRDADALAESCRNQLREMEEQEKVQRQIRKRQEEQQRKAAEQKAKKAKKTVGIVISVSCALLAVVLLANSVVIPLLQNPKTKLSEKMGSTTVGAEQTAPTGETKPADPQETAYLQAEALEAEGELAKAAIAFGKLGDYKDSRERSFHLWTGKTVSTGGWYTIAVKQDGTVAVTGEDWDEVLTECTQWENIVSVDSSSHFVVGLKCDGTVVANYSDNPDYKAVHSTLSAWEDIVAIRTGGPRQTFGLKSDGTVVTTASGQVNEAVSQWKNIIEIDVSSTTEVSSPASVGVIGLRDDGTVVLYRDDEDLQDEWQKVRNWTDIVSVRTTAYHVMGIKADGTVRIGGWNTNYLDEVSKWTDIVDIDGSKVEQGVYIIGLKSDGTTVTVGHCGNIHLALNWKDLVEIEATDTRSMSNVKPFVGLQSDGSIIVLGIQEPRIASFDFSGFQNIRIPNGRNWKGNKIKPEEASVDQQTQYDAAEKLLANGETAKAAIAFGKLGDYSNARERSFALWRAITPVQIGYSSSVYDAAVKKDGTVLLFGYTDARQRECLEWKDIIAVSSNRHSSGGHTVGLKKDGTVVAAGANQCNQCDTSSWSDVIAIDTTEHGFTVGLKSDGTVLYTGSSLYGHETQIEELSSWQDIVAIRLYYHRVVGIKSDGTVVTARLCEDGYDEAFKDWDNIIAIAQGSIPYKGNCYFGVKADGTVVCTNDHYQSQVSQWTDIIALSGGFAYAIGLKTDGTVVSFGKPYNGDFLDLSDWNDIIAVDAYSMAAVGVKEDGTLVTSDKDKYLPAALIKNWNEVKSLN